MKPVVIGTGFVAQAYLRALHYLGYHPMVLSRSWLDYTDFDEFKFFLKSYQPDVVINCSGYTGKTVDDCEVNSCECYDANLVFPYNMALACKAPMIHISTGCAFNGLGPFTEGDPPNFLKTVYGMTKISAEKDILNVKDNCWIFRIRMPFSHIPHPRNWLTKLSNYDRILNGINSVTWIDEFAMRSWQLWQKAPPGIYHATQKNSVSTIEVAKMLKHGVEEYDPKEFLKRHVPRSAAVLDCSKFERAYGTEFTDVRVALRWCIQRLADTATTPSGLAVESPPVLTMSEGASASIG